jgi:inorganic pyrophosphatase
LAAKKIDPLFAKIKDITEIDNHTKKRIKHFFERYKELEPGKWVKVKRFLSKEFAEKEIKNSLL